MSKKGVNSPGNTDVGDGGPAFPVADGPCYYQEMGMSLRDYFAAKALQAMTGEVFKPLNNPADWAKLLAVASYEVADAMLAARGAK